MEEQIRKSDDDRLEEIMLENHQLMDMLIRLAEATKAYCMESEDKNFKEIFKTLNKTYCDAGHTIGMLNINISTAKINACLQVLHSNSTGT